MIGVAAIDIDELVGADLSTRSDAAIADTYVAMRRDIDRREAVAAKLLAGVHDRLLPFGEGVAAGRAGVRLRAPRADRQGVAAG